MQIRSTSSARSKDILRYIVRGPSLYRGVILRTQVRLLPVLLIMISFCEASSSTKESRDTWILKLGGGVAPAWSASGSRAYPSRLPYDTAAAAPPLTPYPITPISPYFSLTAARSRPEFDMKEISHPDLKAAAGKECSAPPVGTNEALGPVEEDWAIDPRNPRNWPPGRKWAAVSVVSSVARVCQIEATLRTCDMHCIK
jgi:hypothetical protein